MITNEFKNIITKVEKLHEEDQKIIAKLIEEEMQWNESLQSSKTALTNLANEALEEYRSGKTEEKDW